MEQFVIGYFPKGKHILTKARVIGLYNNVSEWTDWKRFVAGDTAVPVSPTSAQVEYTKVLGTIICSVSSSYLSSMDSDIVKLRWYVNEKDTNDEESINPLTETAVILTVNEPFNLAPSTSENKYYDILCIAEDIQGNYDTTLTTPQLTNIQVEKVINDSIENKTIIGNEKIKLKTITAEEINVDSLSAINANIGACIIDKTLTMGVNGIIDLSANGKLDLAGDGELTASHLILSEDNDYIRIGQNTGDYVNMTLVSTIDAVNDSIIIWRIGTTNEVQMGIYSVGASFFINLSNDINYVSIAGGGLDVATYINAIGGFKDNGIAGVDGTFVDNNGNVVTVSGGIITDLTT